ncbi:MAG: hypothetical protein ACC682_15650 [Gemmatimonadota bacterium]
MPKRKRVFADFTLIVLGVLTALGAESLLARRSQAALADEYRSRLSADLAADAEALEQRVVLFDRVAMHGRGTLEWLLSGREGDEDTLISALLASERWQFSPASSTYADLESTGNLQLIGDLDVRAALSHYYSEAFQRDEIWQFPQEYRRLMRGIVPLSVQDYVRGGCSVEGQDSSNDAVRDGCPASGLSAEELDRALDRLRDEPELEPGLRHLLSEIGTGLMLFGTQRDLATELIAVLERVDQE